MPPHPPTPSAWLELKLKCALAESLMLAVRSQAIDATRTGGWSGSQWPNLPPPEGHLRVTLSARGSCRVVARLEAFRRRHFNCLVPGCSVVVPPNGNPIFLFNFFSFAVLYGLTDSVFFVCGGGSIDLIDKFLFAFFIFCGLQLELSRCCLLLGCRHLHASGWVVFQVAQHST